MSLSTISDVKQFEAECDKVAIKYISISSAPMIMIEHDIFNESEPWKIQISSTKYTHEYTLYDAICKVRHEYEKKTPNIIFHDVCDRDKKIIYLDNKSIIAYIIGDVYYFDVVHVNSILCNLTPVIKNIKNLTTKEIHQLKFPVDEFLTNDVDTVCKSFYSGRIWSRNKYGGYYLRVVITEQELFDIIKSSGDANYLKFFDIYKTIIRNNKTCVCETTSFNNSWYWNKKYISYFPIIDITRHMCDNVNYLYWFAVSRSMIYLVVGKTNDIIVSMSTLEEFLNMKINNPVLKSYSRLLMTHPTNDTTHDLLITLLHNSHSNLFYQYYEHDDGIIYKFSSDIISKFNSVNYIYEKKL